MAHFQVITSTLNKRTFPVEDMSDKSNIVGQVRNGFMFESKSQITNNLGIWYEDKDGFFYWGGGVRENTDNVFAITLTQPAVNPFTSEANGAWLNFLGLSEIWKITKGESVNIAVLDTGIDLQNPELANRLFVPAANSGPQNFQVCKNLVDDTDDVMDQYFHGTTCSSLVSFENGSSITGVAPNARLFVGKISRMGEIDFDLIAKGILWAADIKEIDIISISFGINQKDLDQQDPSFQKLKNAVDFAVSKRKIIVAAIGDVENSPTPLYPALFENCISVAACDELCNPWVGNVEFDNTTIYAPGIDITAYVVKNILFPEGDIKPSKLSGTSQATAITAGILALVISLLKKKNAGYNLNFLKKLITTKAKTLQGNNAKKVIDPITIFSNI